MQARNKNVDMVRAVACILVLVYHCWTLCGNAEIPIPIVREYIMYGGEIGVTAFFVLSGYGIYFSLHKDETREGRTSPHKFLLKRLKRIAPHYYLNLWIALLFTSSAAYLSKDNIVNLMSHIFFLHSFHLSWHGAINGVLWTMSIIVQFYIVSIPVYKCVRKLGKWSLLFVPITIVARYLTLNYLWIMDEGVFGSFAYSIPGRQLWTSIDNFVIGMYVAQVTVSNCQEQKYDKYVAFISTIIIYLICLLANRYGVWGKTYWNLSYHSILAGIIGLLIFSISRIQNIRPQRFGSFLVWLSRYEYGIYLWHLLIINNLLDKSPLIQQMIVDNHRVEVYLIFILLSIVTGYIMSNLVEGLFSRQKE